MREGCCVVEKLLAVVFDDKVGMVMDSTKMVRDYEIEGVWEDHEARARCGGDKVEELPQQQVAKKRLMTFAGTW